MSIRVPFARSASLGGGASAPLPTETPPAPTGLPSPPTPTSSSNYSSDGTQSTQSSTSPSSSPTTSGQPPSASISTLFSPSSLSDGTSTNYKGSELSTDTFTSISPSSHSSMSTVGGAPTNGPPSGGGITTLLPPVSIGGATSQKSPTTFGPPNSGPATSVSSDALSPSPPSKESGPSSGDLPSITLPSSLPSSIFTSPPVAIPTSPPSPILTSPPVAIPTLPPSSSPPSIPTSPPVAIPTLPPSSSPPSILTSPPSIIPTSPPPPPTQKPSAPLTTSQSSTLPGQQTSSQTSSTTTSPVVGNPTTTSSTPSPSTDKPSTTSDTSLSTPLPGTQTSSQQSTSPTTSTTSDTTTPGQQTSSQQSTSLLTSKSSTYTTTSQTTTDISTPSTSSSQKGSLPSLLSSLLPSLPTQETIQSSATTSPASTDSKHSSETVATSAAIPTSSLTTDSHADTYTTPQSSQTGSSDSLTPTLLPTTFSGGSPTTVPGVQSSFALQSPSGSSADTSNPTGHAFPVSSAGSPTPPGGLAGNPSSAAQTTMVSSNSHSYSTDLPPKILDASGTTTLPPSPSSAAPSGDSWSLATSISQSVTVLTITKHSDGTSNVVQTVTSTSPVTIPFWSAVPTSGARSNEAPIIGGVVGGVLALLLLCIAACYLIRRRRRSRTHQQLYDTDLTAPLSPTEATAMRENHPYSPTYNSVVGGQGANESRGDLHHASGSFGSSAFPRLSTASSPHNFSRSLSGSVLYENFDRESNDGDISSDDESEGTERYFASTQSFYASNDGQSGIGIAIGSQSSTDLHSYHTAATTLFAGAHPVVDNDEECDSPGPSPSAFPIPPVNPFLDSARVIGLPDFVASRASQSRQAVSASSEDAALAPVKIRRFSEQQASWAAAVAAASPIDHDAPTPIAIRSLNALIDDEFNDDSSSQDLQTPTQSHPPATPFSDSSFIDNPFLRETSQEGFSDDSGSSDSHETVSIMYPYPFESRDKGKGKEYLSADLGGNPKNNRLSNASSGIEFPENPSQCGLAL